MGLLTPTRRVYHRWRSINPIYDERECPDCGAITSGREGRRLHREWHMAARQREEWVEDALLKIALHTGYPVIDSTELAAGDQAGGAPDYDEDEEDE